LVIAAACCAAFVSLALPQVLSPIARSLSPLLRISGFCDPQVAFCAGSIRLLLLDRFLVTAFSACSYLLFCLRLLPSDLLACGFSLFITCACLHRTCRSLTLASAARSAPSLPPPVSGFCCSSCRTGFCGADHRAFPPAQRRFPPHHYCLRLLTPFTTLLVRHRHRSFSAACWFATCGTCVCHLTISFCLRDPLCWFAFCLVSACISSLSVTLRSAA
jgi:hypothetical protein